MAIDEFGERCIVAIADESAKELGIGGRAAPGERFQKYRHHHAGGKGLPTGYSLRDARRVAEIGDIGPSDAEQQAPPIPI